MKKALKWIIGLLFFLTLTSLILVIAVTQFLKPNDFKPIITKTLSAQLGHPIDIKGDIKFTVLPNLAFSTSNIEVQNTAGFQHPLLASIDTAELKVQMKPLMQRQIIVDALKINGIKVFLETNAKGLPNWEPEKNAAEKSKADNKTDSTSRYTKDFSLTVSDIQISNANVEYLDAPNRQILKVDEAYFNASKVLSTTAFPIDLGFTFTQIQNKQKVISAKNKMTGKLIFSGLNDITLRDANIDLTLQQATGKPIKTSLSTTLQANILSNLFSLKDVKLKFDETTATGDLSLKLADRMKFKFNLHADKLNLDRYQPATATNTYAFIPTANAASLPSTKAFGGINDKIAVDGQLKIDTLKVANLAFSNVKVGANSNDKRGINFKPVAANLYSGKFDGQVFVDLQGPLPYYQLLGQVSHIALGSFLEDLTQKRPMNGTAQLTFDLRASGLDKVHVTKTLMGNAKLTVKKGTLEGVDLPYYYYTAQSLIKSATKEQTTNTHRTEFDSLTATMVSNHGVITNDDLLMMAPRFKVNGRGKLFLPQETLDYTVSVKRLTEQGEEKDKIPAVLKITGSFEDPKVAPDLEAMAKPAIKEELNRQLNKQLNKIFKNGEGAEANEAEATDEKPGLEDKINKEIDKGLKKLFKF